MGCGVRACPDACLWLIMLLGCAGACRLGRGSMAAGCATRARSRNGEHCAASLRRPGLGTVSQEHTHRGPSRTGSTPCHRMTSAPNYPGQRMAPLVRLRLGEKVLIARTAAGCSLGAGCTHCTAQSYALPGGPTSCDPVTIQGCLPAPPLAAGSLHSLQARTRRSALTQSTVNSSSGNGEKRRSGAQSAHHHAPTSGQLLTCMQTGYQTGMHIGRDCKKRAS